MDDVALPAAVRGQSAASAPEGAGHASSIDELDARIVSCRACPRLVQWREQVAREKRSSHRDEPYWGRPVPGFGPGDASILIVGLAPAAHGANRTGRMFTGDRSGDVLFAALHKVGLATSGSATHIDDGLELIGTRLTSPVRCAPPQNRPTPRERSTCAPFLARELELLSSSVRVILALGSFGWQALFHVLSEDGWRVPRPRPRFSHGSAVELTHRDGRELTVLGCFHVSQRNTFTGRLTPEMLESFLVHSKRIAGLERRPPSGIPDRWGKAGEQSRRQRMTERSSSVQVRRIYDPPEPGDGKRVLVDRLWPRGVSKERADLFEWCRQIAPSTELRTWYSHDPEKFDEFAERYRHELTDPERSGLLEKLRTLAEHGTLTLLTASKRADISEAAVLQRVLADEATP